MFPNFDNDPNGTLRLSFAAAGDSISLAPAVTDGSTLSVPAGLEIVSAYDVDGTAIATSEFTFTQTPVPTALGTFVDATALDAEPTGGAGVYEVTDSGGAAGDDLIASFQIDGTVAVFVAIIDPGTGYDFADALLFDFSALAGVAEGETTAAVSYVEGETVVTWSDAGSLDAAQFPAMVEVVGADNANAELDSQDNQEFTLNPPEATRYPTVNPIVPVDGDYDAWADQNIPNGITDPIHQVDDRGVAEDYVVPSNNAEDHVPTDLPPLAQKNWN